MGSPIINKKKLNESLNKIFELESSIYIKHLEYIQTHDGLGDKFLVMVSLKNNKGTIGFIVGTDYYSCDLVAENFIFKITFEEFNQVNSKNFHALYKKKREETNQSLIANDDIYRNTQDSINLFKDEIKDLQLDVSYGDSTTLEDVIITLNTIRKNKEISNRK